MQAYSDPERETDEYALPDIEVFHVGPNSEMRNMFPEGDDFIGWYWWSCFPGCLPDGEPNGPFATEAEALADAQSLND